MDDRFLEELRRMVAEALEESKREDVMKLAAAMERMADSMEKMAETMGRQMQVCEMAARAVQQCVSVVAEEVRRLRALVEAALAGGGEELERVLVGFYADMLGRLGLNPTGLRREAFEDDGTYYRRGARLELTVHDAGGRLILLEVKPVATLDDVEWFLQKCEAFERRLGRRAEARVMVALRARRAAVERARRLGIELVYGGLLD